MATGTNGKSKDIENKKPIPYSLHTKAKYAGFNNVKRTEISTTVETRNLEEHDIQVLINAVRPPPKPSTLDRVIPVFVRVAIVTMLVAIVVFALLYVAR